jgi:hypothetical protein
MVRVSQSPICCSYMRARRGDSVQTPIRPGGRAMGHEGTGRTWKLGVAADHEGKASNRRTQAASHHSPNYAVS